jgi:S-adenosylmethionine hydrolase
MIALFTDFGWNDPYVGQVHAVLAGKAPGIPVIDLFHAVPNFDICAGAYLLPHYAKEFPSETVFVCVVDPGVGGARAPLVVRADKRWYVGPDNGLFSILQRRSKKFESYALRWRPRSLSASFHGRDLFAPVAAQLAKGKHPAWKATSLGDPGWPDDLSRVIYIDHYGNAITGLRAEKLSRGSRLRVGKHVYANARVFSEVPRGRGFWYENSNGLVELAIREDSVARRSGIRLGMKVKLISNKK